MTRISANERWLPVVGFEGAYEVSDQGRVRSLDRIVKVTGQGDRHCRGRILRAGTMKSGHQVVALGRAVNTRLIHVMVLEAFVSPAPDGMWGRHIDDNPANNTLGNLCWGTPWQNVLDSFRNNKRGRDPVTGRWSGPKEAA